MKSRLLVIIGISIAVFLLAAVVYPTINYKTWGNNELYYTPFSVGTKVVCDEWLWQPPQNCRHENIFQDPNDESEQKDPPKISVNDPVFEMNRNELSQVLDYCNDLSEVKYGFYNYSNKTHSIDTKTCEWKEHVAFPNTDNLCVPYIDKWVSGEEIRNQTHIFDTDSCTWKIDQNYDAVNSKGCPQFCPKEPIHIEIIVEK